MTTQQYPEEAGWSWLQKAGCGGTITEATVPQIAFVMEQLIEVMRPFIAILDFGSF